MHPFFLYLFPLSLSSLFLSLEDSPLSLTHSLSLSFYLITEFFDRKRYQPLPPDMSLAELPGRCKPSKSRLSSSSSFGRFLGDQVILFSFFNRLRALANHVDTCTESTVHGFFFIGICHLFSYLLSLYFFLSLLLSSLEIFLLSFSLTFSLSLSLYLYLSFSFFILVFSLFSCLSFLSRMFLGCICEKSRVPGRFPSFRRCE